MIGSGRTPWVQNAAPVFRTTKLDSKTQLDDKHTHDSPVTDENEGNRTHEQERHVDKSVREYEGESTV
jgi:hypothetical protein